MGDDKAVELRHEGKTYRASSREVFFRWAREHRISADDSYRVAGTDKWIPVSANNELSSLLDPENWWKVKMGGKTYLASDWDTIVRWAREGRLSSDVQVEGPKTPPGGILGKASPELSPYLREWVYDDPSRQPVRIRFDGRIFIPGDMDTLKDWIRESRVPMESEVSIRGDDWQPVADCEGFSRDMWPAPEAAGEAEVEGREPHGIEEPGTPPERKAPAVTEVTADIVPEEERQLAGKDDRGLYRISTSYGEDYVFEDPEDVRDLLRRKRIHSFDEIRHPALPGGVMFVSEFISEFLPHRSRVVLLAVIAAVFGVAGAAAIIFQRQDMQWMLIGGIAALAVSLVLVVRLIWKK